MTGMKISIIFVAVAVINVPANAVPLSHEECEEKLKECEIKVGNKAPNGTFVMSIKYDQECVQEVDLECPDLKIEFGNFSQETRMARNADNCSEIKKYQRCGYDLVCVEKILKECPGIDYTKLRNTLVKKFKEDAEELIYEFGDIKSIHCQ